MTAAQLEELFDRATGPVSIYTVGDDTPFVGDASFDHKLGLIAMHDGETFIDPTHVVAISLFDENNREAP